MLIIIFVELTIDPSAAQRCVYRLGLRHAREPRGRFGELDPKPRRVGRLRVEPLLQGGSVSEGDDREAGLLLVH